MRSRVNPTSGVGLTRDIRPWISASRERESADGKGKGEREGGEGTGKKQKLSANASVILEDPGRSRASGWWPLRSHVRVRRQHCGLMRQRDEGNGDEKDGEKRDDGEERDEIRRGETRVGNEVEADEPMEPVGGTLVVERSKTSEHLEIQYRRNIHRDRRRVREQDR